MIMGAQQKEWSVHSSEEEGSDVPHWAQAGSQGRRNRRRRLVLWLLIAILALSVPVAAAVAYLTELP
jgi:hypothetical protein